MLTSLREYLSRVVKEWWSLVVGGVAGILWLVGLFAKVDIPRWAYIALGVLAVLLAQLRAFHVVRVERDEAIGQHRQVESTAPPDVRIVPDEYGRDDLARKFGITHGLAIFNAGGSDAFNVRITSMPKSVQNTRPDLLPVPRLAVGERYRLAMIRPPVRGAAQQPFVLEWEDDDGKQFKAERYPSQL